jgi:hypothetical protein
MWAQFCTEELHLMPLSSYEVRENRCSEIRTLLMGGNEILTILYIFHPSWEKFGTVDTHKSLLNPCDS